MSFRSTGLLLLASFVCLACSGWYVWRCQSPTVIDPANAASEPQSLVPSARPHIGIGEQLPPIEIVQWIQGAPVDLSSPGARLTLIDVWSKYCFPCHEMAPQLRQIHEEFRNKEVQFVGLTSQPDQPQEFLNEHSLVWSNALISRESIDRLRRAMRGETTPDNRLTMLLLVDDQGRIVWTDDAMRWRHRHQNLDDQIRTAIRDALHRMEKEAGRENPPRPGSDSVTSLQR